MTTTKLIHLSQFNNCRSDPATFKEIKIVKSILFNECIMMNIIQEVKFTATGFREVA